MQVYIMGQRGRLSNAGVHHGTSRGAGYLMQVYIMGQRGRLSNGRCTSWDI